ncbi:MAG: hypothetical protein COW00_02615 [Bdellovibrio sp. CG12_big_fil_rev_8_21_14_0_65_39_13]|nr:MAG: hypothetical protein COW78_03880 [Bdellovibrio sp. CG22_combo_CG10-13_8_21_14_all_39_27]PIQ61950.1 MAG: hypothetical protein COW00_02615 [Bdellovibrio sp. CG12_big_fil_rev_8_21_14_0_65_39_13]PIR35146.1 MAG: hypothetical protein COV37_10130 [Bdellovibrio sp. CG11_big_fil_rev_8_21_14_0_20_39_38]PJB54238.1 MAG: hypothetical protein CO099_02670 [Bdellovibrio sp. CG_4_9_14_3_um_filter_39_7]
MGLLLLTAPPGWGKTQKIIEWHQQDDCSLVYISPLRALTDEFEKRCQKIDRVLRLKNQNDWNVFLKTSKNLLLIVTAEQLTDQKLQALQSKRILYVIDEIHLFYYWGESFRYRLLEIWMCLASEDRCVVAMTATIEKELFKKLKKDAFNNFLNVYFIDQGKNQFQTSPKKIVQYPVQKWMNAEIKAQLKIKRSKPLLVFVSYRSNVEQWLSWAQRNSIRAIGCVGGQAQSFSENIDSHQWQLIVATSVLSHGVNLPSVAEVFITYPIEVAEFWYQMAGRGGRRGEQFKLHHLNKERDKNWSQIPILYFKYLKNRCFQSLNSMI